MKKMIITLVLFSCLFIVAVVSAAASGILCEEEYTVKEGDTLDSIAREFIEKNTYSIREFKEFREGIKESNNMTDNNIYVGQVLIIHYWQ